MELNDEIKLFCRGEGTFRAIITGKAICPPHLEARDFKGGLYTHNGNYIWYGPKSKKYFQLDEEGNIMNKKEFEK